MKNKKKNLRKSSGITLIALVITIVVLIILATVSINMILNDDGIIDAAELAKEKYQNAAKEEQEGLSDLGYKVDMLSNPNIDLVKSDDNQEVPVPKGYVASTDPKERKVSEGFVIKKGTNGAATDVNEFVWVPVSEESFNKMFITETRNLSGETGVETEYYSTVRAKILDASNNTLTKPGDSSGVREPDLLTASGYDNDTNAVKAGYANLAAMAQGFVDDYTNMRESIKKYKGFYIGRYELTGSVESPTVQSGAVLEASGEVKWYELYKACRNVAKSGEKVTSTMIWGCQWDETMNWLKNTKFKNNPAAVDSDSSSWGNYSNSSGDAALKKADGTKEYGSPQITGYSKEHWSANNICDLAGNYFELTQEAKGTDGRGKRGGSYIFRGDLTTATSFMGSNIAMDYMGNSTRVTLYINL